MTERKRGNLIHWGEKINEIVAVGWKDRKIHDIGKFKYVSK